LKSVQDANITLVSEKLKKGSSDSSYSEIVGQVKNVGNGSAEYVEIGITGYDNSGGVIGTDYTYADADVLKSGQKSAFKISILKDDFEGMESYDLSLQWRNPDGTNDYVESAKVTK
jgi:hypothetical protein